MVELPMDHSTFYVRVTDYLEGQPIESSYPSLDDTCFYCKVSGKYEMAALKIWSYHFGPLNHLPTAFRAHSSELFAMSQFGDAV